VLGFVEELVGVVSRDGLEDVGVVGFVLAFDEEDGVEVEVQVLGFSRLQQLERLGDRRVRRPWP